MSPRLMAVLLGLSLFVAGVCAQPPLRDGQGRALILHGLNVSEAAKHDPLGVGWHTERDFHRMRGWGLNAVRLLVFWSHLEPRPGVVDRAYVERVAQRVAWAERAGLWVVVDMHQDIYGPRFGGDGAPVWATRDEGHPYWPVTPWWLNYAQAGVRAAFSHLWRDKDLVDRFASAWAALARRVGGSRAVLGYDLLNEPFFGNEDPLSFEGLVLAPWYRRVATAIRRADPDARIFFEPSVFPTSAGLPSLMPAFGDARAAYAPHYYDPLVHEGVAYLGTRPLMDLVVGIKAAEARRHGAPLVFGEFGALLEAWRWKDYLHDLLGALDAAGASWFYWSYDAGGGFSILDRAGRERPVVDVLVRAYAQAVPGDLERQEFDPLRRELVVSYRTRPGVAGEAELRVPGRLFPRGFRVLASDAPGRWSWRHDPRAGIVFVRHDPTVQRHTLRILE